MGTRKKANISCFIFRILWNIGMEILTWYLQIMWIIFLFGSVVGVVLLLIFYPLGFLAPLIYLAQFRAEISECSEDVEDDIKPNPAKASSVIIDVEPQERPLQKAITYKTASELEDVKETRVIRARAVLFQKYKKESMALEEFNAAYKDLESGKTIICPSCHAIFSAEPKTSSAPISCNQCGTIITY